MGRYRRSRGLLWGGLLFFLPFFARAEDHGPIFYPHLTAPAATVGGGDVTFQAFPGANGLQSFFLNALDLGIGSRLEVGTAPFFYGLPGQSYNFNGKFNFLKLRNFQLAIGASEFAFHVTAVAPDGSSVAEANYRLVYYLVAADLFLSEKFAVGLNVAEPKLTADSALQAGLFGQSSKIEWFVDFPLRLGRGLALTPGFGVLRVETLNPASLVPFGYGATITFIRHGAFLGDVSLGLHRIPDLAVTKFLFSFSLF